MKKILAVVAFVLAASNCTRPESSSTMKGIIGEDDSAHLSIKPHFADVLSKPTDKGILMNCNGVKTVDGRFITAAHCLKSYAGKESIPLMGKKFVNKLESVGELDLATGQVIGGVAPSEGIKIFAGPIPESIELEASWFDFKRAEWRVSKGFGKKNGIYLEHNLDMNPGASGSALYTVDSDGNRLLVGIHLGFDKSRAVNVGLLLEQTLNSVGIGFPTIAYTFEEEHVICYYSKSKQETICVPETSGEGQGGSGGGGDSPGPGTGGPGGNPGGDGGGGDTGGGDTGGGDTGGGDTGGGDTGGGDTGGGDTGGGDTGGGDTGGGDAGGGGHTGGGIIIGGGGDNGGPNEPPEGGGGHTSDGKQCLACKFMQPELEKKTIFKKQCDETSGWTGLTGESDPTGITIKIDENVSESDLTKILKDAAQKLLQESKWKTPDDLQASQNLSKEALRKLEEWAKRVIKSIDDYYALMIANANSPDLKAPNPIDIDITEQGIQQAKDYLDFVKHEIEKNPGQYIEKQRGLVKVSDKFINASSQALKAGDKARAEIAMKIGIAVADMAISFTPGIGWAKDCYEAYYRVNLLTGEPLSKIELSMAIAGAVSVGLGSKFGAPAKAIEGAVEVWGDVAKLSRTAEEVVEIEKAVHSVSEMAKVAENAGVSAEKIQVAIRETQKVLAEGKHVESVAHDGRSVYKMKEVAPGAPKTVAKSVPAKIQDRLAAGETNLDLMKSGKAPIGTDGRQLNLHHVFGTEPGPLIEMEASAHTAAFKEFHKMIDSSFRNDRTLETAYEAFRSAHWINRAKDF